jgi:hypothetical protein
MEGRLRATARDRSRRRSSCELVSRTRVAAAHRGDAPSVHSGSSRSRADARRTSLSARHGECRLEQSAAAALVARGQPPPLRLQQSSRIAVSLPNRRRPMDDERPYRDGRAFPAARRPDSVALGDGAALTGSRFADKPVQTPSASMIKRAAAPPEYCCWPVIRRPSRTACGLKREATMKFVPSSFFASSSIRKGWIFCPTNSSA